jgi:hypothetical protein
VISFSRVEVVNKNTEKDAFCLNIFLGRFDPLKMKILRCLEMWGTKYPETQHHTSEQWIPNDEKKRKITQSPCRAVLRDSSDCCCLRSSKFSLNCIIAFQFPQPGSLPVIVRTILRVRLGVTKFLRNFGSDPCLTSAIQSDWWRIRATVLWSILPLVEMRCRETYCALM